jgi:hypothetical protein
MSASDLPWTDAGQMPAPIPGRWRSGDRFSLTRPPEGRDWACRRGPSLGTGGVMRVAPP